MTPPPLTPTAGIIIIGNEVLNGHVIDRNSAFLASALHELGVAVRKISVVPDEVAVISSQVVEFSSSYDFVLTTGGLGCTPDDKTLDAVARAYNCTMAFDNRLYDSLKYFYLQSSSCKTSLPLNSSSSSASLPDEVEIALNRMACVPCGSALLYPSSAPPNSKAYPLIVFKNIYIFPGPPKVVEKKFRDFSHLFASPYRFYSSALHVSVAEPLIAKKVEECTRLYEGRGVDIGIYPVDDVEATVEGLSAIIKVKLTLISKDPQALREAYEHLLNALGKSIVLKAEPYIPLHSAPPSASAPHFPRLSYGDIHSKVSRYLETHDNEFSKQLQKAYDAILLALQTYGPCAVSISFNGGKDCTILLHLFAGALWRYYNLHPGKLGSEKLEDIAIQALYVTSPFPFAEVEEFIQWAVQSYNIDLVPVPPPMRPALQNYLDLHPPIRAILVGTRRTDPFGYTLDVFKMTDKDWPQCMRVHPILDWTYAHVWTALSKLGVKYCSLYDKGYTSLGGTDNTMQNPLLKNKDESYQPASQLIDESRERGGRIK